MTYTAQNINRILRNRITGKETNMSGWHVMENGEEIHGPMTEELAHRMADAYNQGDTEMVRDCHDIIQHGRIRVILSCLPESARQLVCAYSGCGI